MKKIVVVLVVLALCAGSVFAFDFKETDHWLGAVVTPYNVGAQMTVDLGRFEAEATVSLPLGLMVYFGMDSGLSWDMLQYLIMPDLRLAGYWSAVDTKVFTLNVGAFVDVYDGNFFYYSETEPEYNGWGMFLIASVSPSIEACFRVTDSIMVKAQVSSPCTAMFLGGSGYNTSDEIFPMAIGVGFGCGAAYSQFISSMIGHGHAKSDWVSIGVQFKL